MIQTIIDRALERQGDKDKLRVCGTRMRTCRFILPDLCSFFFFFQPSKQDHESVEREIQFPDLNSSCTLIQKNKEKKIMKSYSVVSVSSPSI